MVRDLFRAASRQNNSVCTALLAPSYSCGIFVFGIGSLGHFAEATPISNRTQNGTHQPQLLYWTVLIFLNLGREDRHFIKEAAYITFA